MHPLFTTLSDRFVTRGPYLSALEIRMSLYTKRYINSAVYITLLLL